jgi:hypothetical protein
MASVVSRFFLSFLSSNILYSRSTVDPNKWAAYCISLFEQGRLAKFFANLSASSNQKLVAEKINWINRKQENFPKTSQRIFAVNRIFIKSEEPLKNETTAAVFN